jgi:ferredoxin/coenzyme F420-reducing hydrogenase delta subunit
MLDSPTTLTAAPAANSPPAPFTLAPVVRGENLLRRAENLWLRLDRLIERALPAALNPFGQLGAIANTCLIVAVATGIALLLWYTPSVHQAYDSLEKLRTGSWLGQLVRSLHRYSSDGCILFVLLHAARIVCQRRFTGARWIAWGSGILMLAALWFIGWTGYWLVWDTRAQHAALGTARFIDQLPIFAEPMSRSFLTNESVPSLLFFLIFFTHMLLPLGIGVGLWLHLMRVSRPRLLTRRAMTIAVVLSLLAVSLALPATSVARADMTAKVPRFTMDWWYLWPLGLTDRLGGGALWALFLGAGVATLTVPWWMSRRRRAELWTAQVEVSRCFGCTLCSQDCPFDAIDMVPRTDGAKSPVQSQINAALCVGCGVCSGSCDSQAINLPVTMSRDRERPLLAWLDARKARSEKSFVLFGCAEGAGARLRPDADGSLSELPNWRVEPVPCVGWISAVMLERALQHGAEGILVAGCGDADPVCREGHRWFAQRLAGTREPAFNPKKADPGRVRLAPFDRTQPEALLTAARAWERVGAPFEGAGSSRITHHRSSIKRWLAAAVLALVLGVLTAAVSVLPYRTPHSEAPELIVSFKHHGEILDPRKLTKEELARRLPHMRAQVNVTRERVPVRLRVQVDGRVVHDQTYAAKGLSKDGPSIAVARLAVTPGRHEVSVEIADTADPERWTRTWSQTVEFKERRRSVVLFDAKTGFALH